MERRGEGVDRRAAHQEVTDRRVEPLRQRVRRFRRLLWQDEVLVRRVVDADEEPRAIVRRTHPSRAAGRATEEKGKARHRPRGGGGGGGGGCAMQRLLLLGKDPTAMIRDARIPRGDVRSEPCGGRRCLLLLLLRRDRGGGGGGGLLLWVREVEDALGATLANILSLVLVEANKTVRPGDDTGEVG